MTTIQNIRMHSKSIVYLFALIPIVDVIIAQVHGQLEPRIGPLSLPQVYHGAMLPVMLFILLSRLRSFPHNYQFILLSALCFGGSVILSLVCELVEHRGSLQDLVAVLQIIYWLVLWLTVFVICRNSSDCHLVPIGITLAGIYASVSVVYLCIVGGVEYSKYAGIISSTGGLVTAKDLGGPLATSALAALWLCRKRFKIIGILAFFVCMIGLIMTYQRTGQVAMSVAILWLLVWYVLFGRGSRDLVWSIKPAILVTLATLLVVALAGTSSFMKRWEDLSNPEKAGSGRLTFWRIASNTYVNLDFAHQLSGIGYQRMLETFEKRLGVQRHTHSDWFDTLLMFGAFGIIGWIILNSAILRIIFSCGLHSTEFAISMSVFLIMLLQSFFTGQMLGPHVMTFYLFTITCITMARRGRFNAFQI